MNANAKAQCPFVNSTCSSDRYKKKLEEDRKFEEEMRKKEEEEKRNDVTKKRDLSDFYRNLNKNIAMGGDGGAGARAGAAAVIKAPDRTTPSRSRSRSPSRSSSSRRSPETRTMRRDDTTPPSREPSVGEKRKDVEEPAAPASSTATSEAPQPTIPEAAETTTVVASPAPAPAPAPVAPKASKDELAAARERFLARKRAKIG